MTQPGTQDPASSSTIPVTPPGTRPNTLTAAPPRGSSRSLRDRLNQHRSIVVVLLACVAVLALSGGVSAVQAYRQYSTVHAEASDGMSHLKRVQTLLGPLTKHPTIPDAALLKSVETELSQAEVSFSRARRDAGGGFLSLAGHVPGVSGTMSSSLTLLGAADEASLGGLAMVQAAETALPLLHAGFLAPESSSSAPALTAAMLQTITTQFETAASHFNSAVTTARTADLSAIPSGLVSSSQLASLRGVIAQWPSVQSQLASVDAWLHLAPSLLGVQKPATFLVELMDRGEVRPTGGFIGSYGILTIKAGQIQPFTLSDIFALDTPYVERAGWPSAPNTYSWWPFAGYGLRDSNLSFDFPTSSRMGIQQLKAEGGPQVQGVIALTEPVIEKIINTVGALPMPQYGVTVTAKNLESLIRYYTETKAANAGTDLPSGDQLTTVHERFTALLGRALMAKLHKLSGQQMVSIGQMLLSSLHTKDLQVYFADPAAEAQLKAHGLDASLTRGPGDGVTVVDANTTGNKANHFTTVDYSDAVTLDQNGTATHHLTVTYHFSSSTDPSMVHYLYGRDYYKTYLRVYVPTNAKLQSFDGFNGGDEQINHSDEPGRQMWGGYVHVQDGAPYSLHFTWSVANATVRDAAGHPSYSLVFQHQAESRQHLSVTIVNAGAKKPTLTFNGTLDRDQTFVVPLDAGH